MKHVLDEAIFNIFAAILTHVQSSNINFKQHSEILIMEIFRDTEMYDKRSLNNVLLKVLMFFTNNAYKSTRQQTLK